MRTKREDVKPKNEMNFVFSYVLDETTVPADLLVKNTGRKENGVSPRARNELIAMPGTRLLFNLIFETNDEKIPINWWT